MNAVQRPLANFPVPASMLRARARERHFELHQQAHGTDRWFTAAVRRVYEELGWDEILDEFQFPTVYRWEADEAPTELMEQLIGQTIGFGMTVTYKGQTCLVVDLDVRPDELGRTMTGADLDDYWRPITIVPLQYFNLEQ